ncbi:unnamed protein product [Rotaria magnacalcarata]
MEVFCVEACEVKGSRERSTIIIRHLFTISNHVADYRQYLEKNASLLKAFLQSRCPRIVNIDQTWHEIARHIANSSSNQQTSIITVSTSVARTITDAGDQRDSDLCF